MPECSKLGMSSDGDGDVESACFSSCLLRVLATGACGRSDTFGEAVDMSSSGASEADGIDGEEEVGDAVGLLVVELMVQDTQAQSQYYGKREAGRKNMFYVCTVSRI